MQTREYRANRWMRIAAVLLCLILVTTYMLSGMYGRYSSTATGSDSARVAGFEADMSMPDISYTELTVDEAAKPKNVDIDITFSSNSEVAVSFGIKIETTDNDGNNIPLPAGTTMIAEYGDSNSIVTADGTKTEYILNVATIEPGVVIEDGNAKLTIDCTESSYNFDGKISLYVIAEQVD